MSEYRRVHRITPLLKFWQFILAAIAMVALNFNQESLLGVWIYLEEEGYLPGSFAILALVLGFAIVCGLVWLVSGVWWRACN